ncbi:hypothetical protein KIN20_031420 [Parelaphostrongylus tenuis]|uniref:Uncharacterized protein n=1 Tax=Parelaphostrongylus tenuis TaxID=148309 RepID=A0AAD5R5C8_PARTN|nr:hypothetical protein KIN20_031420 [Parelaphostrongylus tenuis]
MEAFRLKLTISQTVPSSKRRNMLTVSLRCFAHIVLFSGDNFQSLFRRGNNIRKKWKINVIYLFMYKQGDHKKGNNVGSTVLFALFLHSKLLVIGCYELLRTFMKSAHRPVISTPLPEMPCSEENLMVHMQNLEQWPSYCSTQHNVYEVAMALLDLIN